MFLLNIQLIEFYLECVIFNFYEFIVVIKIVAHAFLCFIVNCGIEKQ